MTPQQLLQPGLRAITLALLAVAVPSPAQETLQHVDWYGLRKVDRKTVAEALGFGPGSSVDVDRDAAAARLRAVPGIEDARILLMLMPGRATALVGIREDGAVRLRCFEAPDGDERVPAEFVEAYDGALAAGYEGIRKGQALEDHDQGHALSRYEPARKHQLRARDLVDDHLEALREALRDAADPKHRAVAAWALGYASDKASIVPDLARAMRDPDATVRNNAVRALSVLAAWASGRDDFALQFDHAPLLEMLESLDWTDRNKSAALLSALAPYADEELLRSLQADSLPALEEMARWSSHGHAAFAVRILAAVAGRDPDAVESGFRSAPDPARREELLAELVTTARDRTWKQ